MNETSTRSNLRSSASGGPSSSPIRPSAAVIPWRRNPAGRIEVYWIRRGSALRFMAGWWAFPGGGVGSLDQRLPIAGTPHGIDCDPPESAADDANAAAPIPANLTAGLPAAAIRELFEETGVLAAVPAKTAKNKSLNPTKLAILRRQLLNREISFGEILDHLAVQPDASRLVFAGRWTTPAFSSIRFDNRFFLFEWDVKRDPEPSIIAGELDHGEWIAPSEALDRWSGGSALLAAPIVHILRVLAAEGPEEGINRLRRPTSRDLSPIHRFVFLPGLVMLPFRTRTLPPATHTNSFLLGANRSVLIDPGSDFPEEIAALETLLEDSAREGKPVEQIWLTHHHADHVAGVNALCRRFDLSVLAHPATSKRLAELGIAVDGELGDGEVIELPGDPPTRIRVLHTPGHAPGHLCFHVESLNALIAGDMVSGVSTIVIDAPEGNMGDYLRSLERLEILNPATMFPSHGSATPYAAATLRALRLHRLQREESVLTAWHSGLCEPEALVERIYGRLEPELIPIARHQIKAHLEHLREGGRI